jgi:hypothetical protein
MKKSTFSVYADKRNKGETGTITITADHDADNQMMDMAETMKAAGCDVEMKTTNLTTTIVAVAPDKVFDQFYTNMKNYMIETAKEMKSGTITFEN